MVDCNLFSAVFDGLMVDRNPRKGKPAEHSYLLLSRNCFWIDFYVNCDAYENGSRFPDCNEAAAALLLSDLLHFIPATKVHLSLLFASWKRPSSGRAYEKFFLQPQPRIYWAFHI